MAVTIRNKVPLGMGAELLLGTYTHTAGAAEETLAVAAGAIYMVLVNGQVASTVAHECDAPGYTTSTSGAITTITFNGLGTVAAGTLLVLAGTGA